MDCNMAMSRLTLAIFEILSFKVNIMTVPKNVCIFMSA